METSPSRCVVTVAGTAGLLGVAAFVTGSSVIAGASLGLAVALLVVTHWRS